MNTRGKLEFHLLSLKVSFALVIHSKSFEVCKYLKLLQSNKMQCIDDMMNMPSWATRKSLVNKLIAKMLKLLSAPIRRHCTKSIQYSATMTLYSADDDDLANRVQSTQIFSFKRFINANEFYELFIILFSVRLLDVWVRL